MSFSAPNKTPPRRIVRTVRELQDIDTIVIHCSATPNGRWVNVNDIDTWHSQPPKNFRRDPKLIGYNQPSLLHIGYHFVIYTSGPVVIGRGLREVPAQVQGHNLRAIGTCMIGTDRFTRAQWASLAKNVEGLRRDLPNIKRICGHRDFSPDLNGDGTIGPEEWLKTCPGFDVRAWLDRGMVPLPENVLEETPA